MTSVSAQLALVVQTAPQPGSLTRTGRIAGSVTK
jgi:hypothetical protein